MAPPKFTNVRQLNEKLGRISNRTRDEVKRALRRGALAIENTAVEGIISPPKTGRVYKSKHRKGATHQASAPGEYPAADSGELHQSITHTDASGGDRLRYEIGTNTPHGTYLELGTSKMAPRPFMGPSYDKNEGKVKGDVRAAVRRGARSR